MKLQRHKQQLPDLLKQLEKAKKNHAKQLYALFAWPYNEASQLSDLYLLLLKQRKKDNVPKVWFLPDLLQFVEQLLSGHP